MSSESSANMEEIQQFMGGNETPTKTSSLKRGGKYIKSGITSLLRIEIKNDNTSPTKEPNFIPTNSQPTKTLSIVAPETKDVDVSKICTTTAKTFPISILTLSPNKFKCIEKEMESQSPETRSPTKINVNRKGATPPTTPSPTKYAENISPRTLSSRKNVTFKDKSELCEVKVFKTVKCEECVFEFQSVEDLTEHVERLHRREWARCIICVKTVKPMEHFVI